MWLFKLDVIKKQKKKKKKNPMKTDLFHPVILPVVEYTICTLYYYFILIHYVSVENILLIIDTKSRSANKLSYIVQATSI